MKNIQNLTIDINKKPFQKITANVGEVASRFIRITILENNVPVDLTGVTAYLYAKKPDGTKVFNSVKVENIEQGIVLAELTSQVLAISGIVELTLLLTKDGSKLASKQIIVTVDESAIDEEAIESTNEFNALTDALKKVNNIDSKFENVNSQINIIANKGTTVEVLERVTKEEIERQMNDGTIASLTIADNSITNSKYQDKSITNDKIVGLDFDKVNVIINSLYDDSNGRLATMSDVFASEEEKALVSCENGNFYYSGETTDCTSPIIKNDSSTGVIFNVVGNYQIYLGRNNDGYITTVNISSSYFGNIYNRRTNGESTKIFDYASSGGDKSLAPKENDTIKVLIENNIVYIYNITSGNETLIYEKEIPNNAYCLSDVTAGLMMHRGSGLLYGSVKFLVGDVRNKIIDIVKPTIIEECDKRYPEGTENVREYIYDYVDGFDIRLTYFYSDDFNTGDNSNVKITETGEVYYTGNCLSSGMPSVMFNSNRVIVTPGDNWHLTLGGNNEGYTTLNIKNGATTNRKLTSSTTQANIQKVPSFSWEKGDSLTIVRDGIDYTITNNNKNITSSFTLSSSNYAYSNPAIGILCHSSSGSDAKYKDIKMSVEKISEDLESKILDSVSKNLNITAGYYSRWTGKKWATLGDSITARGHYQTMYNEILQFSEVTNYGVGGTCIAQKSSSDSNAMCIRYANMSDDYDLVTVWGGVNDFGYNFGSGGGIELGTIESTSTTTFYGGLKALIDGLQAKYPTAKIAFILPAPINGSKPLQYTGNNDKNAKGYFLEDYCRVLEEVCEMKSIPYINLRKVSGFNDNNIEIMTSTKEQTSPDGLHPSLVGFKYIQNKIVDFLNSL